MSAVLVGVAQPETPVVVASQQDPLRFPNPDNYTLVDNTPPLAYLGLGGNQAWWTAFAPDAAAGALFGLQDKQRFLDAGGTEEEYFASLYTSAPYPETAAFDDLGTARPIDGVSGYLADVSGADEVITASIDTTGAIRVFGPMRDGYQQSLALQPAISGFDSTDYRGMAIIQPSGLQSPQYSAYVSTLVVTFGGVSVFYVLTLDGLDQLQLLNSGNLSPSTNGQQFLAMSHSPSWTNQFNSARAPIDPEFFMAESFDVPATTLARPRVFQYGVDPDGVPVLFKPAPINQSAPGLNEMQFERTDASNGHLFDLQVDRVQSGNNTDPGYYVGYRGPSSSQGTTRGFVGRVGAGAAAFNWGNESLDCEGDMDFLTYQSQNGGDPDLNDATWTMACAWPNPASPDQIFVVRNTAAGGVNDADMTVEYTASVYVGDGTGARVVDPQIQVGYPCLELFRSTGAYRANQFIGATCPNIDATIDTGADENETFDDVITITNPGDPTVTVVTGIAGDSADTYRHDVTRATINHALFRDDGLQNQWTPQVLPELGGTTMTTLVQLPFDRIVTRVDLDAEYDGCRVNANTVCAPPISADGAIPLAVLAAPPQVANANQTTFDPPIYATAQSVGGGTSTSLGSSAGFSVGVKHGADFGGAFKYEVEVVAGYDWSFSQSTGRSVEVTQSQAFTGLEDADSVVYQSQRSYLYKGVILESSNGLSNGDEIVFIDPISVNRNVTSWENLQDIEASQFGPPTSLRPAGGVFYESIEAILSHDVGDPGSYPEFGDNGSSLDDRCLGNTAGTEDEFAALGTYRSARTNAFTPSDEYPTPQDAILFTEPFATIAGSTNGEGAEIEVAQGTERTYNIEHEFGVEVNVEVGSDALAFVGGVRGGISWGGESTYELGQSTAFSASVGHFPDPDLDNETYGWRMYLCKQDLAANGGFALPFPVHVLGFTVDGYSGSGGIQDLDPIEPTSGIFSEKMPRDPLLQWRHPSGTIETYEVQLEAIGVQEVRRHTISYQDTVEGSAGISGGRSMDLSWSPAGGVDLLPGQLYRWRVVATDFFGNMTISPFNFFVTEGETGGGGGGTTTGGTTTGGTTTGGTTTGGATTGGTTTGGTTAGGSTTGGTTTGGSGTGGTGGSTDGGSGGGTSGGSTGGSDGTEGGVSATLPADGSLRINVAEAAGGRTVIGQLTAVRIDEPGFLTAYACDDGIPRGADGTINKADLNFSVPGATSNRLVVPADDDGDICIYTSTEAHIVTDIFGSTDDVETFPNRRTDTRKAGDPVDEGSTIAINVPEAKGGQTVIGQLTVAQPSGRGFLTVYACDEGLPRDADGRIDKSDLNFFLPRATSNRLIAPADDDGDICIYTLTETHIVADIFGVTDDFTIFINQRTDSRLGDFELCPRNAFHDGDRWVDDNGNDIVEAGEVPCVALDEAPPGDVGQMFATHRINVPEAKGGLTVIGQLTVSRPTERGFLTAFACDEGLPRDASGRIDKSDLNHSIPMMPTSNRLIVPADDDGDICIYTSVETHIVADISAVTDDITIFTNQRTDTRP